LSETTSSIANPAAMSTLTDAISARSIVFVAVYLCGHWLNLGFIKADDRVRRLSEKLPRYVPGEVAEGLFETRCGRGGVARILVELREGQPYVRAHSLAKLARR